MDFLHAQLWLDINAKCYYSHVFTCKYNIAICFFKQHITPALYQLHGLTSIWCQV